jgi:hypothetical protein
MRGPGTVTTPALIDDFSSPQRASNGHAWRFSCDRVMGGVSSGRAVHSLIEGRRALLLDGRVSLDNNGGFVQLSLDLADADGAFDASGFTGLRVTTHGDGARYALNLRTRDLAYPWQSYRSGFTASRAWETHDLPFGSFEGKRTDRPLDPARLRRVGLIAIGEERTVAVAIGDLRFY